MAHNITVKSVDLLVRDSFSSMDAIELLDKEDLAVENTARPAETATEGPPAPASDCGRADDGGGHVRGWRNSPGEDQAVGAGQNQLAGEAEREVYTHDERAFVDNARYDSNNAYTATGRITQSITL